jgi:hypothetical protein
MNILTMRSKPEWDIRFTPGEKALQKDILS